MNCTCFDRALAPVILLTPDWKMIYSNPVAQRQFPLLASSVDFSHFCSASALAEAKSTLCGGQAVSLAQPDGDTSFLLSPVFGADGNLNYISVCVELSATGFLSFAPEPSDGELAKVLRKEIMVPVSALSQSLRHASKRGMSPEIALQFHKEVQLKLAKIGSFIARIDDVSEEHPTVAICDADDVLRCCKEVYRPLKYTSGGPCLIPSGRRMLMLIVTDILGILSLRQEEGAPVKVSLSQEEGKTRIEFKSSPLIAELDQPQEEETVSLDVGLFSIRRRMEICGGTVSVVKKPRGNVVIALEYPEIQYSMDSVGFRDSFLTGVPLEESWILQVLASFDAN